MKLRIVKSHKNHQGEWRYKVQLRTFFGWMLIDSRGANLTLDQANSLIDEIVQVVKTPVVKEIDTR